MSTRKKSEAEKMLAKVLRGNRGHEFKIGGQVAHIYGVQIDSEMANQIIEYCNLRNRRVRQKIVMDCKRDLARDRWLLQATLLFADDGELLDGQHRMLALKDCDTVANFLVHVVPKSEGKEANLKLDTGAKRSLADTLKFHGVPNSGRVAPILQYERNYRISAGNPFQKCASEKGDYLALWRSIKAGAFATAFQSIPRGMHSKLKLERAVLDWVALHLAQIDETHAALFLAAIETPSQLREADPVFVLNRAFTDAVNGIATGKKGLAPLEQGAMLIKTWNRYFLNEETATLRQLRYKAREDFPVIQGEHQ